MYGNSITDRYTVYFNSDTIFLGVKTGGIWTKKVAYLGSNIILATTAVNQDTIWICWKEGTYIKTRYSTDNGTSWQMVYNVSTPGGVSAPSIYAASNGKIHFVWYNETATDTTIMHTVYAGGAFLGSPNTLSSVGYKATWPSVTAIGDTVLCCWKETHGTPKSYFTSSFNGGITWSGPASTNGPNTAKDPNVAYAYDNNTNTHYTYLVYDGTNKIYLQRSTDFGTSWTSSDVVSNAAKRSQFAKVVCNNTGFVGISWEHRTVMSLMDDTKKDVGFCYSTSWGDSASFSHDSLAYTYNPFGSPLTQINKIDENNFYLSWVTNDTVNSDLLLYERWIEIGGSSGITEQNQIGSLVYPNPANDFIHVTNANWLIPMDLKIFNLQGQEIIKLQITSADMKIDVRFLENGIYFLYDGVCVKKIMIHH